MVSRQSGSFDGKKFKFHQHVMQPLSLSVPNDTARIYIFPIAECLNFGANMTIKIFPLPLSLFMLHGATCGNNKCVHLNHDDEYIIRQNV
jgi:hypothetical protein